MWLLQYKAEMLVEEVGEGMWLVWKNLGAVPRDS